jgi:hypothetical protein
MTDICEEKRKGRYVRAAKRGAKGRGKGERGLRGEGCGVNKRIRARRQPPLITQCTLLGVYTKSCLQAVEIRMGPRKIEVDLSHPQCIASECQ